ncbi:MAG: NUDIX hydrolase [Chloroflexi bacterium]|nr:NUDIX hydrolase [Chloroflexota bacterium]
MPLFHVHVDAIVRRGEEILIMKRAMGAMTGAWYIPGGSLEENESPEDGLRREIREETQLEVESARLFRVWEYRQDESTPAVGITFICDVAPDAEPQINEEHSAARWVTAAYYRERFFTEEAMAALAENPIAVKLVEGVRGVLDAYLAEEAESR